MSKGIIKSSLSMIIIVLLIKILGFAKQILFASIYGATLEMDIFFISSGILDSVGLIIFSSFAIALMPVYSQIRITKGQERADYLLQNTLITGIIFSVFLCYVFCSFSVQISSFLAPRYGSSETNILAKNIRIMSLTFLFYSISLILNVKLEAEEHFLPGKGQSLFQNLLLLFFTLFFASKGPSFLIYAFLLAGLMQCSNIIIRNRPKCLKIFNEFLYDDFKNIVKKVIPILGGSAIYEINDIVDKQIASIQAYGSVSVLSYGSSLNDLVVAILIATITTVLFSKISNLVAANKYEIVNEKYCTTIIFYVFILTPLSFSFLLFGQDIVSVIYCRGQFRTELIEPTAMVLICYGFGFVFQAIRTVSSRVFYAFQDAKTPLFNGVISVVCNIILSLILSKRIGVSGIALATSISMLIGAVLYIICIKYKLKNLHIRIIVYEGIKAIFCSFICMCICFYLPDLISIALVDLIFKYLIFVVLYLVLMYLMKSNMLVLVSMNIKDNYWGSRWH